MQPYLYKAKITKIYDADTVRASLDLGFGIQFSGEDGKGHSFRLARINAPEVRGEEREEGLVSRDALRELMSEKEEVIIQSVKTSDKYGRYVAELFVKDDDDEWMNVNDWLVENNYAKYKNYD